MVTSAAEQFLTAFHDQRPGITSVAYGARPVHAGGRVFASSYECLAATVPESAHTVLDLACGDGHLLALLRRSQGSPRRLLGIDLSAGELKGAQARLGDEAQLSLARAQCLPLQDGSVDQVVCHMALMLMDDLDRVLDELRRVLVPGGRLAFTIGARPPPRSASEAHVRRLRAMFQAAGQNPLRMGDARLGNAEGIHQALAGRFEDVQVEALLLPRRCTPLEAWEWVNGMYDLHMVDSARHEAFRLEHLAELVAMCEADGRLDWPDALNQVTARAA